MQRNNDFNYKEMDPHGYAVPLGSHIRRMNPRDTAAQYEPPADDPPRSDVGPHLPEGAPDDGVERGIAAFVICASLIRQFEFAQNVWVNDGIFTSLATSATRSSANHDGTLEYKIPKRPIRKKIVGLPAFTTRARRRLLLPPGHQGARLSRVSARLHEASLSPKTERSQRMTNPARTYNQDPRRPANTRPANGA